MQGNALSMERKFFHLRSRPASCNGGQLSQSDFAWRPQSSKYSTHQLSAKIHIGNNCNNCSTSISLYSPRILWYQHLKENPPEHHYGPVPPSCWDKQICFEQVSHPRPGQQVAVSLNVDNLNWKLSIILFPPYFWLFRFVLYLLWFSFSHSSSSGFKLFTSGLMDLEKDWDPKPKPWSL